MSLVKSTLTIGSLTFVSRIFGFVRDVLMANLIGASWLSDAFFVAFKLPNFFRRLLAEGAFSAAFVPMFAGMHAADGKDKAMRFASEVLSVLLVILLLLNAVFIILMPVLLHLFAPGFTSDPEKYALTVDLARICFPYILFISLVSLFGGILNSIQKFAAFAAAPILLNLCMVAALLFFTPHTPTAAHALSFGVFMAGVVQLAWILWFCKRENCLPSLLVPKLTSQVRDMLKLIAPAALGAGVAQVNLLIDVILASNFEDGVSYLYYADRINELPIGVIGVAVGTALLPMMARQIREGKSDLAAHSLNRAIELVLLAGIPACLALLTIPHTIITALYQHGEFSAIDTNATYTAMMAFAAGLPAFVLIKVLAPAFFANKDTKTPFIIATGCVALNLILNLILMQFYEHVGLAMATSIAGWVNALWMAIILYRRRVMTPDAPLLRRVPLLLIAGAVMTIVLLGLNSVLKDWMMEGGSTERGLGIIVLVGSGMGVYFAMVLVLKIFDLNEIKGYLRGKKSPKQQEEH